MSGLMFPAGFTCASDPRASRRPLAARRFSGFCIRFQRGRLVRPITNSMEGNGNLLQIREAARLAGCHPDSLRRYERAGIITSRRGANGYRLFDTRDLARLLGGGARRPRRVPLDRVHRRSFMENGLPSGCVDLVFFRPPTADARAGVPQAGVTGRSARPFRPRLGLPTENP